MGVSTEKGHRTQFLAVQAPADVEISGSTLYAPARPRQAPPKGKVIKAAIR